MTTNIGKGTLISSNDNTVEPLNTMNTTLIVEDNDTFRQTLKSLLNLRFPSMNLQEARDGKEALEKIIAFRPELIFVDIKLPGENGLELTRKIQGVHSEGTVIVLTSYDFPEYRKAAYENGARYFVSKGSTSSREIVELVESIFSSKDTARNCRT